MKYAFICMMAYTLVSCVDGNSGYDTKQLFDRSLRRDPLSTEMEGLVKLKNGCSGFILANELNRELIMTARHCTNEQPENWCSEGGEYTTWDGRKGSCMGVAFSDPGSDIIVVEGNSPPAAQPFASFVMNDTEVLVGTSLQMIGFPADRFRMGRMTLTENCEITATGGINPNQEDQGREDPVQRHNCSTYGGNSGGPLVIAGTKTVVGLPITYLPGYYELLSSENPEEAAYLASSSGFRARFSERISDLSLDSPMGSGRDTQLNFSLSEIEMQFKEACLADDKSQSALLNALFRFFRTQDCAELSFKASRASEINLSNSGLFDLDLLRHPIFRSGSLKALYLAGNPLTSVESVSEISSLVLLDVSNTKVEKFREFSGPQLEFLYLRNLKLESLAGFMEDVSLPKLRRIFLDNNRLGNVTQLKSFPTLRVVSLSSQEGDTATLKETLQGADFITTLNLIGVIYREEECPLVKRQRCIF